MADGLPAVLGNRTQLQRVLSNLLQNGIDAMHAGRTPADSFTIEVRTARTGEMAQVTVRDHGPGLAPWALDRVFEKFYRAHDSLSNGIQGSGLGLTIARQIMLEHGGTIDYTYQAPHVRFTLHLPAAPVSSG